MLLNLREVRIVKFSARSINLQKKKKKGRDDIFPIQTEQASSMRFYSLSRLLLSSPRETRLCYV